MTEQTKYNREKPTKEKQYQDLKDFSDKNGFWPKNHLEYRMIVSGNVPGINIQRT